MAGGAEGKRKGSTVLSEHTSEGSVSVITGFNLSPHSYWDQVVHKGNIQVTV